MIAAAGLALSALANLASGVGSTIANKKAEKAMLKENDRQNAWYHKQMYQDPLERSENVHLLKMLDTKLKNNQDIIDSSAAITGATTESKLAAKQGANKAYSDAVSGIASLASQRADIMEQSYNQEKNRQYQGKAAMDQAKMQNWANLASNAAKLGASSIGGIGGGAGGGTESTGNDDVMDLDVKKANILNGKTAKDYFKY